MVLLWKTFVTFLKVNGGIKEFIIIVIMIFNDMMMYDYIFELKIKWKQLNTYPLF